MLLGQSHGVISRDSFELFFGKHFGVNLDATLGSTVRETNDGVFEGHEAGEGFGLLDRYVDGVPGTSLGWKSVSLVLDSEGFNNFDDAGVWIRRWVPVL